MAAFCSPRTKPDLRCLHSRSSEPRALAPSSFSLQIPRPSLQPSAAGRRLDPRTHGRARARCLSRSSRTSLGDRRLLSSRQAWQRAASNAKSSPAGTSTAVRDSNDTSSTSLLSESSPGQESSSQAHVPPAAEAKAGGPAPGEKVTKDVVALRSLDAYFEKLQGPKPKEEDQAPQVAAQGASSPAVGLKEALQEQSKAPPADKQKKPEEEEIMDLLRKIVEASTAPNQEGQEKEGEKAGLPQILTSDDSTPYQQWLDAQLGMKPPSALNILLAVNVAVFLFELASPEAVPGLIVTSLPSLLGAKVNALVAAGEWWRLVTPMFLVRLLGAVVGSHVGRAPVPLPSSIAALLQHSLHAGFFHILLGSVVLLSLGPSVEVAFGSFGFFSAYFVGGVFGNLMSFLQTADVTVGGTGPIYGILGAYLVYLWKNKDAIGKEEAEGSLWSLIFFGALNIAFGSALPIDDWTHIGAALGGLLFGALAAPTLKRMPVGFTKLQDVLKAGITGEPGKMTDSCAAGSSSSSSTGSVEEKNQGIEPGGTLFLLEGPGPKRQAWIAAACLGVAALLLQLSSTGIPADLLDLSSQMVTL